MFERTHFSIGGSQLQHHFYTCLLTVLILQRRKEKKTLKFLKNLFLSNEWMNHSIDYLTTERVKKWTYQPWHIGVGDDK